MNILALDLGSKTTGWAMLVDGVITTGVQKFKRGKNDPRGKTILDYDEWFSKHFYYQDFSLIAYEAPHLRGQAASFFGVGLAAVSEMYASAWEIPIITEHTQTIKKFAAGSAKVTDGKSQTLARAQQFNPAITDDNEADSLCLLLYVMTQKGIPIPPYETHKEG